MCVCVFDFRLLVVCFFFFPSSLSLSLLNFYLWNARTLTPVHVLLLLVVVVVVFFCP
jgi:hypothetical protein